MIVNNIRIFALLLMFFMFVGSGCSSSSVQQYADNRPRFDLFEFFNGSVRGWGIVQDRSGTLLRQFVVDIDGQIDAQGRLVLTEDFVWNDGELSRRIWTIEQRDSLAYSGRADDVIGVANGRAAGNALNWSYTLDLKVDGSSWDVVFDDWMFMQPDNVLINRATMKKFGFRLGDITIAFIKGDI